MRIIRGPELPHDRLDFGQGELAMRAFKMVAFGAFLAVAVAGCKTTAKPNWFNPGTAPEQKARAIVHDPYPENEPGPRIEGIRPREYERPLSEVDRARLIQRN
jgi:hypothetical protein